MLLLNPYSLLQAQMHAQQTQTVPDEILNHPLFPVFVEAIKQALYGKGQRHGGGRTPFPEQPIFHYARMHGRGFLTGQAAKKLEEAATTREGQAFIDEMLGTLVYAGAAILRERQQIAAAAEMPPLVKVGDK